MPSDENPIFDSLEAVRRVVESFKVVPPITRAVAQPSAAESFLNLHEKRMQELEDSIEEGKKERRRQERADRRRAIKHQYGSAMVGNLLPVLLQSMSPEAAMEAFEKHYPLIMEVANIISQQAIEEEIAEEVLRLSDVTEPLGD